MLCWEASHYLGSLPLYCCTQDTGIAAASVCLWQHRSMALSQRSASAPSTVLLPCLQVSWQRVRVANWLAHTGEEWVRLLDTLNSGTYNNQYMARLAAA